MAEAVTVHVHRSDDFVSVEFFAADGTTTGGVDFYPSGKVVATIIDGMRVVDSMTDDPDDPLPEPQPSVPGFGAASVTASNDSP